MIQGVDILGFRGIAKGKLADFRTTNVFVGPNACGKSTVLEAIYIAASESPAAPLRVERSRSKNEPFRWWFYRGQAEQGFKIHLALEPSENYDPLIRYECRRGADYSKVNIELGSPRGRHEQEFSFDELLRHSQEQAYLRQARVRFVDVKSERLPLPVLYTEVTRSGLRQSVFDTVARLIPNATGLEILTSSDGEPELNVSFKTSAIPVALMGDGISSLVRQCLELASHPGGLVFMEEPEAFKHPAAINSVAAAIMDAAQRKTQIFLTTHSLELIDGLLEYSAPLAADIAIYRMRLDEGNLLCSRFSGRQAFELRKLIEEDLR